MTKLSWDATDQRRFETGVDHGVLYEPDESGDYTTGVAWNGLTTVTESPSGAEATPLYADNMKYLNLVSTEEFGATIEAYTCPEEFFKYDGTATPSQGVYVGQQGRSPFGLSYRTRVGDAVHGSDKGYKIHLVWNATAAPSEKAFSTINDSPEAITFSWALTTTPVPVDDTHKPTALITIDSTKVDATALAALEDALYGTAGEDPRLPSPAEVLAFFSGTVTTVTPTEPAYDQATHVITIPTVTGVEYKIDGEVVTGTVTITEDTLVTAEPLAGYKFSTPVDDEWLFTF